MELQRIGHNWSVFSQREERICEEWRGTKKPLDESESDSEKVGLKLNIQKIKIMASGPITSREIDGETVSDFIFWAPKSLKMVTAAMKL